MQPPARALVLTAVAAAGAMALHAAVVALSGAGLHVDEAQYWLWSHRLQWGYLSKPPGVAVLIAGSTALFGDSVLGLRLLAMACWTAAALPLAALALDAAGTRAALWTMAVWLAAPLTGLLGLTATTDAPLVAAWAVALWSLWQAVVRRWRPGWGVFALALALGLLSKYAMALLLPGAAWFVWRQGRDGDRRAFLLASLAGLSALAPHLAWNAEAGWPTFRHVVESTGTGTAESGWAAAAGRMLVFAAAQLVLAGPLALWVAGTAGTRRAIRPPGWLALLVATSLPLLATVLLQALRGRVEVNWAAPAHLSAALWMGVALADADRRRAGAALAAQVVLATLLALGPAAAAAWRPGLWLPSALDPWARMRGWDEAAARLAPHLTPPDGAVVLGDSRTVLAQMAHAWRGRGLQFSAPDLDGVPRHHFELDCRWPLPGKAGAPLWLLTAQPPDSRWTAVLQHWTPVAQVEVPRARGQSLRLFLARAVARPGPVSTRSGACA